MYKNKYKPGSYGGKPLVMQRQSRVLAEQQAARYSKVIANRPGGAPPANRGFGNMAIRLNREKKFFDIPVTNYVVTPAGLFTLLHVPQLGSDFYDRIGRKTVAKSVYIRGYISIQASLALTNIDVPSHMARMIIFVDSQPNGAAPAVTDLLNTASVASQLNPNNRDRFQIIKDKQFSFDAWAVNDQRAGFNRTTYPIKCYKKLNLETIFGQTSAGTIGDINTGALYMFWIGSTNIDQGDTATLGTRIRFDDQ